MIFAEVDEMNQVKIGKYIACLRKEAGLTQEKLGEKLGVTNKTVSRWENGNYMPDIEMFGLLAKEFNVTVNDLLAGEKTAETELYQKEDETNVKTEVSDTFTIKERKAYFKKKWRREHRFLFVILGFICVGVLILAVVLNKPMLTSLLPLIALVEYGYQNNRMMTYVENNIYR